MVKGTGAENDPYISEDKTAGLQERINGLKERGGKLALSCGRYEIEESIILDTPCIHLDGDSWSSGKY